MLKNFAVGIGLFDGDQPYWTVIDNVATLRMLHWSVQARKMYSVVDFKEVGDNKDNKDTETFLSLMVAKRINFPEEWLGIHLLNWYLAWIWKDNAKKMHEQ